MNTFILALTALATVSSTAFASSSECLGTDTFYTVDGVDQCCPIWPEQPAGVTCKSSIVEGYTSVTCSFPDNGDKAYAYIVPQSSRSQALYAEIRGAPGDSTRYFKGGRGASLNGTFTAEAGSTLSVYVGAGGGGTSASQSTTGKGTLWGAGGGYSSIGAGLPNGQDGSGGHCFKQSALAVNGDCRLYVAGGGGGAGPSSDGENAGLSKSGFNVDSFGDAPRFSDAGGGGGGFMGGKTSNGKGGGGGSVRVGPGGFTTSHRSSSTSTSAFVSIRASCVPPPAQIPSLTPSSDLTVDDLTLESSFHIQSPSVSTSSEESDPISEGNGLGTFLFHSRRGLGPVIAIKPPKIARDY